MNIAYNMDCLEAMREMPDNAFDLAVVDPPYGDGLHAESGGGKGWFTKYNMSADESAYRKNGGGGGTALANGSTATSMQNRRTMGRTVRQKNCSVGHSPGEGIL